MLKMEIFFKKKFVENNFLHIYNEFHTNFFLTFIIFCVKFYTIKIYNEDKYYIVDFLVFKNKIFIIWKKINSFCFYLLFDNSFCAYFFNVAIGFKELVACNVKFLLTCLQLILYQNRKKWFHLIFIVLLMWCVIFIMQVL
jgi:hypothetical protein